jgi:hypothetical protein
LTLLGVESKAIIAGGPHYDGATLRDVGISFIGIASYVFCGQFMYSRHTLYFAAANRNAVCVGANCPDRNWSTRRVLLSELAGVIAISSLRTTPMRHACRRVVQESRFRFVGHQ